jgi:phosphatidate cytidylyltransferase
MEHNFIDRLRNNNIISRSISALILIPVVLFIVYAGGLIYFASMLACFILMMKEWQDMYSNKLKNKIGIFKMLTTKPWFILGSLYIFISSMFIVLIRLLPQDGMNITLWLLLCVWGTDIGGYFAGIKFGGPKIAPKISPNKTWSGLIGAVASSSVIGYCFSVIHNDKFPYFIASMFLPIVAQTGDFLESAIKRYFGVKDSGNLIPGHGGLLDRMDGLLSASILTWILCVFTYI